MLVKEQRHPMRIKRGCQKAYVSIRIQQNVLKIQIQHLYLKLIRRDKGEGQVTIYRRGKDLNCSFGRVAVSC